MPGRSDCTLSTTLAAKARTRRDAADASGWTEVILASVQEGVVATNDAGRIVFMNPAAEALTEWSYADAFGREVGEVLPCAGEPRDTRTAKKILRRRTGTRVPIEVSETVFRSEGPSGSVLVFRDISERLEHGEDFCMEPLPTATPLRRDAFALLRAAAAVPLLPVYAVRLLLRLTFVLTALAIQRVR